METNFEIVKVAGDLHFPEGPAYDGKGNLYVSNCNSDYVTKVDAAGEISVAFRAKLTEGEPLTFKKTNGMAFYKDGSLFACDFGRNVIIRISMDGTQEIYAENYEGVPFRGPNDLAFDPHGNLYFTDPAGSDKEPIGSIYRVDVATKKVAKVAGGMRFPNGLAFTADAKTLYVCESHLNRMVRFDVHQDGTLGEIEHFATLGEIEESFPDGMAVDIQGNLWIAHYMSGTVVVVSSEGAILQRIPIPGGTKDGPTNVEFAGADMKTLYVTHPGDNALFKFQTEIAGIDLFCAPNNIGS